MWRVGILEIVPGRPGAAGILAARNEAANHVAARIGISGVNGYGGRELLRLCLAHPGFEVTYVSGESTAGQPLSQLFPALVDHPSGRLVVQPFVPEDVHDVDLLFASLPTGA